MSLPIDQLSNNVARRQPRPTPAAQKAIVKKAPASPGADLYVVIPSLSATHLVGPCKWQPMAVPGGVRYPVAGDECAVIQDTDGRCWIIGWSPTTYTPLPGT